MAQTYPPLPDGPVICSDCAQEGKRVEMVRDESATEAAHLQSYRCPSCESVEVFHFG